MKIKDYIKKRKIDTYTALGFAKLAFGDIGKQFVAIVNERVKNTNMLLEISDGNQTDKKYLFKKNNSPHLLPPTNQPTLPVSCAT